MRGLKATRHPGLFKYKAVYWGRIKVGKKQQYKSLKTQSESAALASLGIWRKELELEKGQAAASEGVTKHRDTVGWAFWKLKAQKRNSADLSPDTSEYVEQRVRFLYNTWPALFTMKPKDVSTARIEQWKNGCLKTHSRSTVRGTLIYLRQAFELAKSAGLCAENVAKQVGLPRVPRKLAFSAKHQVSSKQFDELLATMRKGPGFCKRAADLAELLASTGLRLSEAVELTWDNVEWGNADPRKDRLRSLSRKRRKDSSTWGEAKRLPLHKRLRALLQRLTKNRREDNRIAPVKECRETLETACRKLKMPKLHHHDMRHLFTTWCVEAGIDFPTIAAWLGHQDGGAMLAMTYAHLRDEHSEDMAEKLDALA
jgi:integrase